VGRCEHHLAETRAVHNGYGTQIKQHVLVALVEETLHLVLEEDVAALVERDVADHLDDGDVAHDSLFEAHAVLLGIVANSAGILLNRRIAQRPG
jgi:hypothetical protein